ncbi:ATP-binding protein [Phytohabitans aurantiacus]|uniref:ATP-binding protein n=1 Tax=Phytohabitans aurantiacus TaxID=3016789 RepID=UPI002492795D|nr:adenylate/guanylate cyclase domain-containing protein [Phytohabitans aurantiacus]
MQPPPQEDGITAPCPRCARAAALDDRFCAACGAELPAACPRCGRQHAAVTAFCTGCGAALHGTPAAPVPQEDRRRISVLFVDLIDFTPYVERADPEQVRGLQIGFFSAARRVIGQYGGVVEKYIGDAVMALFGAPVATETDALRCVRAGLELQRVLARFAPPGAGDLRFRVGVATGEALVDVAAARDGGQAIVAGDVVNTASRMQSIAPPGGVLVCGTTHALTRSRIRYAAQEPVTLRGRSAPTEVWLAEAPLRRPGPDRSAGATPLTGREHEVGLLSNALHRALRDRTPQLVTVFGQAGIGKSRLVHELRGLVTEPVTWHVGHCPPFGENVTFAALADIVKAEAGILDTDPAPTAERRLAATVRELVPPAEAERLVGALRPLVGLRGGPSRVDLDNARTPAEEAESAWRRFLVALAARRPTVLVFEDLHWADETMLRFLDLLAGAARDAPLMILCTARPELADHAPAWARTMAGALSITLPPLRDSGIAAIYGHLFGQPAFAADMLHRLIEVADGNPLYAHEFVRMLIEQGALRQSGRGWSLDKTRDLPMPDGVHAIIANRVDLLDSTDRAVLLAAAVVGSHFWPGAVAASLGQPVELVERSLRRLAQRDFVHELPESTIAGQPEFRFRHVLVRDVCYQRLPRTERVARHERTADWLDALSGTRDTDLAEVLTHHRWAAHATAQALGLPAGRYAAAARDALHRAARRAYALHALDAAGGHAERALALPDAGDDLRLDLLATEIAFRRDGHLDATDGLTDLAGRLLAAGDHAGAARAWTLLGQAAWLRADRPAALSCLDRAVELFDSLPDTVEKADAYAELGRSHMLNYEGEPAIAAAGAAVEIASRLPAPDAAEVLANARITVAMARYQLGDPAGLDELWAVTRLCRERRLRALPRAVQNLAYAVREEGDWVRSDELLGSSSGASLATGYSGEAMRAYFAGDFGALLAAADAFLDTPGGRWDIQVRGLRSALRVLRGDQTADDVDATLEAARGSGFHRPHWTALGLGALCRALQGRRREAGTLLTELADSWRRVPVLASGEWVTAAAYAAVLTGADATARVAGMLAEVRHRTPWVDAARHTLAANAAGYLAAAEIYAGIPDATDRVLALTLAVGELRRAGDRAGADAALGEVRAFAHRNRAPGLLRLAEAGTHPRYAPLAS